MGGAGQRSRPMSAVELLRELRSFELAAPGRQLFLSEAGNSAEPGHASEAGQGAAADPAQEDCIELGGVAVPRIANEYWTHRQRQGHSLHELSYRACFKAELPRFFVERLTRSGDVVFDPFMGRGTTLLEAALLGRVPWGNDVNPLSRVLVEARLAPPTMAEIDERLDEYEASPQALADPGAESGEPEGLDAFYHEETLGALRALRARYTRQELDPVDAWLRMVATNRLTGHSSGFFSVRTMPPNQAVSVATQKKLNAKHERVPPLRDVRAILARKSRSLLRDCDLATRAELARAASAARFFEHDARALETVPDASVHLIVTSPPFLNVVDYAADNWLRCWFNGLDVAKVAERITCAGRADAWQDFVKGVMLEFERVLAPGAWAVFEVGEVRGGKLLLEELVLPAAMEAGLRAVAVAVHAQGFTKTANCWGVANNAKGTNTNRMVILQKRA